MLLWQDQHWPALLREQKWQHNFVCDLVRAVWVRWVEAADLRLHSLRCRRIYYKDINNNDVFLQLRRAAW